MQQVNNYELFLEVTFGFGTSSTADTNFIAEWDLNNDLISSKSYAIGSGHSQQVNALKFINNTHLVSGSDDFNVKIWLISTGTCIRNITVGAPIKSLALLKNGYLSVGLFVTSNNIKIYDINNGSLIKIINAHSKELNTVEVFPNGDLASGGVDNDVNVWDVSTLSLKFSNGFGNNVNCLKILVNGNIVAGLLKKGNNLQIWVPGSSSSLHIATHGDSVIALEVLANDTIVSSSDTDPTFTLIIWGNTLNQLRSLTGQSAIARALKLLPNGLLASGTDNSKIHIWNTTNATLVKNLIFNLQIKILTIEYKSKNIFIYTWFFIYT